MVAEDGLVSYMIGCAFPFGAILTYLPTYPMCKIFQGRTTIRFINYLIALKNIYSNSV